MLVQVCDLGYGLKGSYYLKLGFKPSFFEITTDAVLECIIIFHSLYLMFVIRLCGAAGS